MAAELPTPVVDLKKTSKYFSLCLRGLPHHYTGLDTSRLSAVYFAVLGLDMIGERAQIPLQDTVHHILSLQLSFHPQCRRVGYSGFLGSAYLGEIVNESCCVVDGECRTHRDESVQAGFHFFQGHIAMTYTAIVALVALGDDLSGINKASIIAGLKELQDPSGAFRSTYSPCECDMRFLYCACAISAILGDWSGVNVDRAVNYVRSCVTYEGGVGLVPGAEAHGGSTYCALASLQLMGRLDALSSMEKDTMLRWCLRRQDSGFSGRTNKTNDTCYSFWIGASIHILGGFPLTDVLSTRGFVAGKCHSVATGGFGKTPAAPPDILHSFYSLAWLSLAEEPGTHMIDTSIGLRQDRSPPLYQP
mmetsp:Transcript_11716/g.17751  ORF Transcript_11716/g.17751 Transcript_11716/m.17751 type:complete len:361 (-) Transcript_11716:82-1164(-)